MEYIAKRALSFANSIVQLHLKSCLSGIGTIAILLNEIKIFLPVKICPEYSSIDLTKYTIHKRFQSALNITLPSKHKR